MKRTARLDIRLSDREQGQLKEKMRRSNLSASALFRIFLRDAPIQERPNVDVHKLYAELNHIGSNINQIARIANSTGNISDYDIKQIQALLRQAVESINERAV